MGDCNAKHRLWGCSRANRIGTTIAQFVQTRPITVLDPSTHTTRPYAKDVPNTTIDLTLAKNPNKTQTIVLDELNSDHLPCIVTTSEIDYNIIDKPPRANFKKADWDKFKTILNNNIDINNGLQTPQDIDNSIYLKSQQS